MLCFISVPNVSFEVYAPGFLDRFFESHAVMLQGNAGLKPKEGEITSKPWQWPLNYRVTLFPILIIMPGHFWFNFKLYSFLFLGTVLFRAPLHDLSIGQPCNLVG